MISLLLGVKLNMGQVYENDVALAGVDDMITDHAQLESFPPVDISRLPAISSRDEEMASEIAGRDPVDEAMERRRCVALLASQLTLTIGTRLKIVHDSELVADHLRDRAPGLLNPLVTVEYMPFIRHIVAAEDVKDAAFAEDVKEGRVFGFSVGTRRSARINNNRYGRRFDPDPDVLELVRQSGL